MLRSLSLAFAQLPERPLRRAVLLGVGGAVIAVAGLVWAAVALAARLAHSGQPWLDAVAEALGGVMALVPAWFLFPLVATMLSSLLLDEVVNAVEKRHYPALPPPQSRSLGDVFRVTFRFIEVALLLNLLALPLYLIPGVNGVLFYLVNGTLIGRDYFELVALRRLEVEEVSRVRRANSGLLLAAGVIVALLATVPVVNLTMPVVGSAFIAHLYHRRIVPHGV